MNPTYINIIMGSFIIIINFIQSNRKCKILCIKPLNLARTLRKLSTNRFLNVKRLFSILFSAKRSSTRRWSRARARTRAGRRAKFIGRQRMRLPHHTIDRINYTTRVFWIQPTALWYKNTLHSKTPRKYPPNNS